MANFTMKEYMSYLNQALKSLALGAALLASHAAFASDDKLIDSVYGEFATGTQTQMVRAGVTSDWSQRWFQSNGTHRAATGTRMLAHGKPTATKTSKVQSRICTISASPRYSALNATIKRVSMQKAASACIYCRNCMTMQPTVCRPTSSLATTSALATCSTINGKSA